MASKKVFLIGDSQKAYAKSLIDVADEKMVMTLRDQTRTDEQNKLMWPLLEDISKQVEWYGRYLSDHDWKDILTAALKNEQRMERGLDGQWVLMGTRTSNMSVKTFSELIELIYAFGAKQGVIWSEPKQKDAA